MTSLLEMPTSNVWILDTRHQLCYNSGVVNQTLIVNREK